MREKLIELLEQAKIAALVTIGSLNNGWGAWYADYLLAHGVTVLPCKSGDTVFVIPTKENKLAEITKMLCIGFSLGSPNNTANLINDKNKLYQPAIDKFGKSVFLSREAAEAALEAYNATD